MGQKCKVVSRWSICIHVTVDVLGMNGLQVTVSALEPSGLLVHDAMSEGQSVRYVGKYSFIFKGQKVRIT